MRGHVAPRILIADDDEGIRDMIRIALELQGYEVAVAADGAEALEKLSRGPRTSLVLLDLMMPNVNGWEVAEAIKADQRLATIPVVFVTAYADRDGALRASPTLRKPFDLDELFERVKRYARNSGAAAGLGR
jgi:CheY-like chemotaxis protein